MSLFPFDDPESRMLLWICRTSPGFIPIVLGGHLYPVREPNVGDFPVTAALGVPDCLAGLEVLGCRLERDAAGRVTVTDPPAFRSALWARRAGELRARLDQAG